MPEKPLLPAAPTLFPACRRWINWLALDAVAVALAWLAVFAQMKGARLDPVNYAALAAAVWLIYMVDRLIDGRAGNGSEERHRFAANCAPWLLPVMILLAAGMSWWVLHAMRWITVAAGLWIAAGVVFYALMITASRWKAVSHALLLTVSTLMLFGLVQGEDGGRPGVQLWRAVAAGTLLTMLYFGMRQHFNPPPWILIKKGVAGYLFALGVAVGPFSHLQDWGGLLKGAPVLLFGGACALNSLGIRLWENPQARDPESQILLRLYPWLLSAVALGALAEAWAADPWSRPVLIGIAACAAGFALIHFTRRRWKAPVFAVTADLLMVVIALAVRWAA